MALSCTLLKGGKQEQVSAWSIGGRIGRQAVDMLVGKSVSATISITVGKAVRITIGEAVRIAIDDTIDVSIGVTILCLGVI